MITYIVDLVKVYVRRGAKKIKMIIDIIHFVGVYSYDNRKKRKIIANLNRWIEIYGRIEERQYDHCGKRILYIINSCYSNR